MKKAPVSKKKRPESKDRDIRALQRLITALNAVQHNPIAWAAVIKSVAPMIASLAARYAAGWLATKWNKRTSVKIRKEVAEDTAERIVSILSSSIKG